jgi:predicted nuclease with RNAse H fold
MRGFMIGIVGRSKKIFSRRMWEKIVIEIHPRMETAQVKGRSRKDTQKLRQSLHRLSIRKEVATMICIVSGRRYRQSRSVKGRAKLQVSNNIGSITVRLSSSHRRR